MGIAVSIREQRQRRADRDDDRPGADPAIEVERPPVGPARRRARAGDRRRDRASSAIYLSQRIATATPRHGDAARHPLDGGASTIRDRRASRPQPPSRADPSMITLMGSTLSSSTRPAPRRTVAGPVAHLQTACCTGQQRATTVGLEPSATELPGSTHDRKSSTRRSAIRKAADSSRADRRLARRPGHPPDEPDAGT